MIALNNLYNLNHNKDHNRQCRVRPGQEKPICKTSVSESKPLSELASILNNHSIMYPTPINFSYFYNFGSLATLALFIQIITGIFLVMHYVPHTDMAFSSIEHIMRDVKYGWLMRYAHANGATFFFAVLYIHIGRGIYYQSYTRPRQYVWASGVVIFLLTMATAFLGYILPWGQMSFWGATVITSMVTVIPYFGDTIVFWLWGGFAIDQATLHRFFSLHYLLPFIITGVVGLHIWLLHFSGSHNPLGLTSVDYKRFAPNYIVKDMFGIYVYLFLFLYVIIYYPNYFGHPDNYIKANPLKTPLHVVPEWYFLPYYAMLRCIPHKAGGILAMLGSILILFILPFWNTSNIRHPHYKPLGFRLILNCWFFNFLALGYLGKLPVHPAFTGITQIFTFFYFFFFLIYIPLVSFVEKL